MNEEKYMEVKNILNNNAMYKNELMWREIKIMEAEKQQIKTGVTNYNREEDRKHFQRQVKIVLNICIKTCHLPVVPKNEKIADDCYEAIEEYVPYIKKYIEEKKVV